MCLWTAWALLMVLASESRPEQYSGIFPLVILAPRYSSRPSGSQLYSTSGMLNPKFLYMYSMLSSTEAETWLSKREARGSHGTQSGSSSSPSSSLAVSHSLPSSSPPSSSMSSGLPCDAAGTACCGLCFVLNTAAGLSPPFAFTSFCETIKKNKKKRRRRRRDRSVHHLWWCWCFKCLLLLPQVC